MKKENVKLASTPSAQTRLHKRIADSGLCSRRAAERLIAEGRVKVNGVRVNTMGVLVDPKDKINVDGQALKQLQSGLTIALNKPVGVVTTKHDPEGRPTVMQLLPVKYQHLDPVGRLDQETEGLLLLTSDGELLNTLTHPRYEHTKTYEAWVRGELNKKTMQGLESGKLRMDGKQLQPMRIRVLKREVKRTQIQLILREGRKRQIRRVMQKLGHNVLSLRRTVIGTFSLGRLAPGAFKVLNENELKQLYS